MKMVDDFLTKIASRKLFQQLSKVLHFKSLGYSYCGRQLIIHKYQTANLHKRHCIEVTAAIRSVM